MKHEFMFYASLISYGLINHHMYGLMKVYKESVPLRPTVSSKLGPVYVLRKFLFSHKLTFGKTQVANKGSKIFIQDC